MAIKSRTVLKSYFVRNAIPTEGNFADLIDSQLNQEQDGVFKRDGEPLSVVAAPGQQRRALRLYSDFPAANPDWMIGLNDKGTPGFGLADSQGRTRLFIKAGDGHVGVGTTQPRDRLEVAGAARVQSLKVTPGKLIADKLQVTEGTELNNLTATGRIIAAIGKNSGIEWPRNPGGGSGDRAFITYHVTNNEDTTLTIGNNDNHNDRIDFVQKNRVRLRIVGGEIVANSPVKVNGNISSTSDLSLKRDISTLSDSLEKILRLRGVSYNRRDQEDNGRQLGLIAQEVDEVFPELVTKDDDGVRSIAYLGLMAPLIEAVKELHAEVELLRSSHQSDVRDEARA